MNAFSLLIHNKNYKDLRFWLQDTSTLDIVENLIRTDPESRAIAFRLLPKERSLDVFELLDPALQQEILQVLREGRVQELLERMEPDDRARLFDELPSALAKSLLDGLSFKERKLTSILLGYPENSVGRFMSPEFVDLQISMTVHQAIQRLRTSGRDVEAIYSLPVTDSEGKLVDVIDLGDLVLADPNDIVGNLVTDDTYAVTAHENSERASRLLLEANLIALPVVDSEDRLVGVLTFDDAMELLQESDTEDILRSGGSEPLGTPYFTASLIKLTQTRAIWLMVLALAATLTVNVLNVFQQALHTAITLTLFIPLLIGIGGNIGSQSATIIIRAMALGEVKFSDFFAVLFREIRVGMLLGTILGVIGFIPVGFLFNWDIAIILSTSLLAIATLAALAGSLLPMIAKKIGIDPAVVSAPIISTLVDTSGLIIYFQIARTILGI